MALSEALTTLSLSLQNERKWRNIQAVLPESFGLVVHVLSQQAQMIEKLELRVQSIEQLEAVTSAHIASVEERICADMSDRITRLQKEFFGKLKQQVVIQQRIKTQYDQQLEQVDKGMEQKFVCLDKKLDQWIANTQQQLTHLSSTRTLDEESLAKLRQDFDQKVEDLKDKLVEREVKEETAAAIFAKEQTSLNTYKRDLNVIGQDLARIVQNTEEAEVRMLDQVTASRKDLMVALDKKICKSEMTKLLSRKMDAMDTWKQLAEKADCVKVEEVACNLMDSMQRYHETTLDDLDRLKQQTKLKVDALELVQVKHNMHNLLAIAESMQHELSTLQRQMSEKMTIADGKALVESQLTRTGLQKAMIQVENVAADPFATKAEYDDMYQQVQAITRQLRSEMYQARYIWKDGRTSAKQTIQWSAQAVNSNSDVFLWQFGSDEIWLHLPGLYHLQAAFFTTSSPAIQVLVNGEPAILVHSSADLKEVAFSCYQRLHHTAGNLAGLSVDVFLALPARAVVAISYDIEEKVQGFLNFRKI